MHKAIKTLFFSGTLTLAIPLAVAAASSSEANADTSSANAPNASSVASAGMSARIEKIDKLVRQHFFDGNVMKANWPAAYDDLKNKASAPLTEEQESIVINEALKKLNTSHCQFVGKNDEAYYFLRTLFKKRSRSREDLKVPCVGLACGGRGFEFNRVRYVLNGSPAEKAGLAVGDVLVTVNDKPYKGYSSWFGADKCEIVYKRAETKICRTTLKPALADIYDSYVEAMEKSVKIETRKVQGGTARIGYVHLWVGGEGSSAKLQDILKYELADVDGLVLDLRDGYGANSLEDISLLYRNEKAFPDFVTVDVKGKANRDRSYFDRPVVAIINGGSRSGKELIAFSLKRSGRALLVGENTAGYFSAGTLFSLDDNNALYLAVAGCTVGGVKIEGQGVAPDIACENTGRDQAGYDRQLKVALQALEKRVEKEMVRQK